MTVYGWKLKQIHVGDKTYFEGIDVVVSGVSLRNFVELDSAFPPIRFPNMNQFSGERGVYYGLLLQRPTDMSLTHTLQTLKLNTISLSGHSFGTKFGN